jgi:hypothetical protein
LARAYQSRPVFEAANHLRREGAEVGEWAEPRLRRRFIIDILPRQKYYRNHAHNQADCPLLSWFPNPPKKRESNATERFVAARFLVKRLACLPSKRSESNHQ